MDRPEQLHRQTNVIFSNLWSVVYPLHICRDSHVGFRPNEVVCLKQSTATN